MKNRRNYYRILHVQPEAPAEIIRASYRSLMTKLRNHPDLGGDHDIAALINEAYAVLGDPERRLRYDRLLVERKRHARPGSPRSAAAPPSAASKPGGTAERPTEASPDSTAACPFCGAPIAIRLTADSRCGRCESALAPLHSARRAPAELFGRRAAARISKSGLVWLFPDWPHPGVQAKLKDLSPHGFSLSTALLVRPSAVLKFESAIVNGVAEVVTTHRSGAAQTIHARFLTAQFVLKAGGLVSVSV